MAAFNANGKVVNAGDRVTVQGRVEFCAVSSVWLERHLDTVEARGSSPLRRTICYQRHATKYYKAERRNRVRTYKERTIEIPKPLAEDMGDHARVAKKAPTMAQQERMLCTTRMDE